MAELKGIFDLLLGSLQLTEHYDDQTWPDCDSDIRVVRWAAPEPDVGFNGGVDEYRLDLWIGDAKFSDVKQAAEALYGRVGSHFEENVAELADMLNNAIDNELADYEPAPYYPEEK